MELSVVVVLGLLFSNVVSLFVLVRTAHKNKRLEDRLWGLAARTQVESSGEVGALAFKGRNSESGRLEQLESQVDMIAQQLDRLVESQEFLSRIITDRADRLPDPRLRTPH